MQDLAGGGDLIGKEFQFETLLLHECFTITKKDLAVQLTSLPDFF